MARKHQHKRVEDTRLKMEVRCDYLNKIADERNAHIKTQKQNPDFFLLWEVQSKPRLNSIMFPVPILVLKKTVRPVEKAA